MPGTAGGTAEPAPAWGGVGEGRPPVSDTGRGSCWVLLGLPASFQGEGAAAGRGCRWGRAVEGGLRKVP